MQSFFTKSANNHAIYGTRFLSFLFSQIPQFQESSLRIYSCMTHSPYCVVAQNFHYPIPRRDFWFGPPTPPCPCTPSGNSTSFQYIPLNKVHFSYPTPLIVYTVFPWERYGTTHCNTHYNIPLTIFLEYLE